MKKYLISVLGLFLLCGALSAKNYDNMRLRMGFLSPADSKFGLISGFSINRPFDETVELGTSLDFYKKNYSEKREISYSVSDAGNQVTQVKQTTDINIYYFPAMINLRINLTEVPLKPYIGAGAGWGFLWEDVYVASDSTYDGIDAVKFYNGFNWNISTGLSYKLGSRSKLFGEIIYNGGAMTRDKKKTDTGITWEEIDMSGIGLRAGIEFRIN